MTNNYLTPVPIIDPRLTPDLRRIRSGSAQHFADKDKRTFDPDFVIESPLPHVYAELIDEKWHWKNGCGECNGLEPSWTTYIKCEQHDVCYSCKTPRKNLTEVPWGHRKGFECKPCVDERKKKDKEEALAKMGTYDSWDYQNQDSVKCPYCDYELEADHNYYDAEEEKVECSRCDNTFIITAHPSVSFTMRRGDENDG